MDAGKPESPTKLTKPSWKYIARKTLREFSDDQCTDLAAALTYYSVLALFPALLALIATTVHRNRTLGRLMFRTETRQAVDGPQRRLPLV